MSGQDRSAALFFEVFSGLPQQAPGDEASTLRALALVPGVGPGTRVLDLGCGTGRQTRTLAMHSQATLLAIDNHPPFVEAARREAGALGLADRVEFRVGDMGDLQLPDGSFDVIWCEGAVYAIGIETALRRWRRLLGSRGHVVLSDACWMRPDPPPECVAFWTREYPAMRDVATMLAVAERSGYGVVGHFSLPTIAWWTDYYRPLEQNVVRFRARHAGETDALALADQVQEEIDVWKRHGTYYGYEFVVLRTR